MLVLTYVHKMYNDLSGYGHDQTLMERTTLYPTKIELDEAFTRNKYRNLSGKDALCQHHMIPRKATSLRLAYGQ